MPRNTVPGITVSIPFKRESTLQVQYVDMIIVNGESFHSLQTGKHIASQRLSARNAGLSRRFPFPSNGKAHCKRSWCRYKTVPTVGFPFPSNGKAHCKVNVGSAIGANQAVFPFPSNGKAHCKRNRPINASAPSYQTVSIPFKRESTLQETPF